MAMLDRTASLPTIKCSDCGVGIEIEKLADHLCGSGLGSSIAKGPPRSFNDAFSSMSVNQSAPAPFRQKPIPRPIDSNVANVPFLSRSSTSTSNLDYKRSGPSVANKHSVEQRQRRGPPSPELTLPQECAFPAFPLPSKSPTPERSVRTDTKHPAGQQIGETSHISGSNHASSQKTTDDLKTRQIYGSENNYHPPAVDHSRTQLSSADGRQGASVTTNLPDSSSTSMAVTRSPPRKPPSHNRNQSVAAAYRPLDDIGSIRTHRPAASRSESTPTSSYPDIPRSASAQGQLYSRNKQENIPPVPGTQLGNGHEIPRSASAMGSLERRSRDAPPLPIHMQQYRSEAQTPTRHTPSESTSSNQSDASRPGTSSSRSSPPTSNASISPQRRDRYDLGNPYSQTLRSPEMPEKPVGRRATKSFSRPSYAQPTPSILSPDTFEQVSAGPWQDELKKQSRELPRPIDLEAVYHANGPYRDNPPYPPAPASSTNQASKRNRLPNLNTNHNLLSSTSEYPNAPRSAMTPSTRPSNPFPDTLAPSLMPQTTLRRAATTSKGKCRGCGEVITGKSVSSADGRLSGRWHKQCFTCKTCSEPFPTMDFYVIGNDPYCNRHYHQLNKSLCSNCDRGIEGQYVDNDRQKFHPHCFTCSECHFILRDTYFDLNGKIFCERHAFKVDALPPFGAAGRRYPEKRSTRLMMI